MLVLFSLMLTSTQYFGNPIDCTVSGVENKGLVNTYCWTHGTFTVQNKKGVTNRPPSQEERDQMTEYGHYGFAQPGMQTFERQYYYFYPWVSFVLFLQVTVYRVWCLVGYKADNEVFRAAASTFPDSCGRNCWKMEKLSFV